MFDQGIPNDTEYLSVAESTDDRIRLSKGLLRSPSRGVELPLLTLRNPRRDWKATLIWTSESGKDAAFDDNGRPTALLAQLLERGFTVLLPDLMRQGEWGGESNTTGQRLVDDPRSYSAFTFGYNRTLVAERCADVLLVVAHAGELQPPDGPGSKKVCLLATGKSASWAAPAAALAGPMLARAAIVTNGFRFAEARRYQDAEFVPGAVKYGDLPTLLALRAPHPLMVLGEPVMPEVVNMAFTASGASDRVQCLPAGEVTEATIAWLAE